MLKDDFFNNFFKVVEKEASKLGITIPVEMSKDLLIYTNNVDLHLLKIELSHYYQKSIFLEKTLDEVIIKPTIEIIIGTFSIYLYQVLMQREPSLV
jgi:hypothetical protein